MIPSSSLELAGLRVLDGAMATELERRGCDISGPLWSAAVLHVAPQKIAAVHTSYLDAGADCILTASYQISFQGFAEVGLSRQQAGNALRLSVQLAEDARSKYAKHSERRVWVAASLGPYGAALHNGAEYHGNYDCTFDELVRFHAERLDVLQGTSADLIAFETIPSLEEARAIVAALRLYPGIAAWISFTCTDGRRVAHGERIAECAAMLDAEPQVAAIGINCTAPQWVARLIGEVRGATQKPVLVYPNSGETWDAVSRCWHGESDPAKYGELAKSWYKAGAQAVGGCCRTGPEHVRAIRAAVG